MKKLTAAAAVAALAFGGCATETTPEKEQKLGSVEAALSLPGGLVIDTVNYQVEDAANTVVSSGPIDVSQSSRIEFQVGNLPIANDYEMLLTAQTVPPAGSTEDPLNCMGSAGFDIANNGLTTLTMTLTCEGGIVIDTDANGDIRVTVNVEQEGDYACPVVTGISALPAETAVGGTIQLEGFLSSGADTTGWSGVGGTFASASTLATGFTCTTVGVHTLALTASKERCTDTSLTVSVECSGELPTTEISCTDNVDNDQDGQLDCLDTDCATDVACLEEICDNGTDDDQDGLVDCADDECAGTPSCPTANPCIECINAQCTDYNTINLAGPCFNEDPNGLLGPVAQPEFTQLCSDAVMCSINAPSGCGSDLAGPARCYCGEQPLNDCVANGPVAGAECAAEWQAATQCPANDFACVAGANFSDLARPSGYAFFTIECANANCAAACQL